MPTLGSRIGLFCSVLAAVGVLACTGRNGADEAVGVSTAPLDAYCTATVKNVGDLDTETDYLPHVVHCENGGAPLESLKAQAVAARSYLYYKLQSGGSIADGQGDQVYSCASEPDADDIEAVKETSGIVLQYQDETIAAFFVAGATSTPPACMDEGSDSTDTVRYVTYNAGLSGANITQTSLGFVSPSNYANRGCMSQLGSRCLANGGDSFDTILKFYYGDDIQFTQASGSCVLSTFSDGGAIVQDDGGIVGSSGGTGGPTPTRGDGSAAQSSDDGSTLTESGGCNAAPGPPTTSSDAWVGLIVVGSLIAKRRKK